MASGYHLGLSGAAVTFYVRPQHLEQQRLGQLQPPQRLYCYDDHSVKTFEDYRLACRPGEITGQDFDFVIVTLDGAASRSESGSALIRDLANATGHSTATWIIAGVGTGLREHIFDLTGQNLTGLGGDRLLEGSLGMLCHQVKGWESAQHPETDTEKLSSCAFAYHHFSSGVGFLLAASGNDSARAFASLYNRSGISRCQVVSPRFYRILSNMLYPLFATCEIAGWPGTDALAQNRELWQLCCKAMTDIACLHLPGWAGPVVRMALSPNRYLALLRKFEKDSQPLDFHAFNRFHHGAKVLAQDIQIMENSVRLGEQQGKSTGAVREILRRLKSHFEQRGNQNAAGLIRL